MKESIIDWFLDRSFMIALILGIICLAVIFAFDFRGFQVFFYFLISLLFLFLGQKFFDTENADTWLKFSYSEILLKILGGVFLFTGWSVFLRSVLALAIASLLLKFN